jgi:hypothetical protein
MPDLLHPQRGPRRQQVRSTPLGGGGAGALLSDIGGGATVLPPVDGAWFNPDTGMLIKEKIVLAYTYVQPGRFIRSLPRVRAFLHRMGRQTRQGEVVAEFANRLYRITTFDTA